MKTYFWDFFGPRSEGTARHFRTHLIQFLEAQAIAGCDTGLASEGTGHQAVYCRSPEPSATIESLLKPKRCVES